jgi:3-phenylpropionate/trans-cinnamate dioxygenase ferredoxin component
MSLLGTFIKVCSVSELPPGSMRGVEHDGKRIIVVNLEGTLYAWDGTCTHEEYDLSMGFLTGDNVTCALHLSQFNLITGEAVNPPAERPLGKHQVKVVDGSILVEVA